MVTNTMTVLQRENARLRADNDALSAELRQLREFVDILVEMAAAEEALTVDATLLPALQRVFDRLLDLLRAPEGSLLLLDDETGELQFVLVRGGLAEHLRGYRIPATEGIAGWVISNAAPALVRDVRRDSRFSDTIDDAFKFRTQSIAAAPLICAGRVLGVLEALNQPVDEPFSDTDVRLLGVACRFAGEALGNAERAQPADET
jgi:GAF domain-containing protein